MYAEEWKSWWFALIAAGSRFYRSGTKLERGLLEDLEKSKSLVKTALETKVAPKHGIMLHYHVDIGELE